MWDPGLGERGVVRRTGWVTRKLAKGTSSQFFENIYVREASRAAVWPRPEENGKSHVRQNERGLVTVRLAEAKGLLAPLNRANNVAPREACLRWEQYRQT